MTSRPPLTAPEIQRLNTVVQTWWSMSRAEQIAFKDNSVTDFLTARGMDATNSWYRSAMRGVSLSVVIQPSHHH